VPGPLSGVSVVELAGIGPCPFAGMLLADMGARVIAVGRPDAPTRGALDVRMLARGRPWIDVDLKDPRGVEVVLRLVRSADALVEGFRPGVMERLCLGPDDCLAANPRLVYGRVTGWGQDGPLARRAGHDINFIALAGALAHFARPGERPLPPANVLGDFGGGGMFLAFGVVCALLEARRSGRGQVVDAAMVDGTALLMTMIHEMAAQGRWDAGRPGTNLTDTGAPFYDVYETADGRFVAIGAIEPKFYDELLRATGLEREDLPAQMDRAGWDALRDRFTALFRTRSQSEWCRLLEGADCCFAPVLSLADARGHPHLAARDTFPDGVLPGPAPRFSRTPPQRRPSTSADGPDALTGWGFSPGEVADLTGAGVVS